jgi:hypothetical protein
MDNEPKPPEQKPTEPVSTTSTGVQSGSFEVPKSSGIVTSEDGKPKWKQPAVLISLLLVITLIAAIAWKLGAIPGSNAKDSSKSADSKSHSATGDTQLSSQSNLVLDPNKNYGNKYANGLLPVGDDKYHTDKAEKGYVYTCRAYTDGQAAGAGSRGPWFVNNNTQWDYNKKYKVQGNIKWKQVMNVSVNGGTRTVTTNSLPPHITGVFPIASSDPVYKYDRNPSTISAQSLTYSLNAAPTAGNPQCMGGEAGVMLTGIPIFSAFDAGGRDAGAWEAQDGCDGHPQNKGEYHYHTLSRCITDQSVKSVIGFALDGFPITGPKVGDNNILTTSDLDECHGITSEITLDGKKVTTYHYVMTQDFPYSVSCFRAKATNPPGQQEGGAGGGGGGGQQQPDDPNAPPPDLPHPDDRP